MQPPPLHVQESWAAAEFYANKVLMEWKAKDPAHVPWVQAVKELMLGLKVRGRALPSMVLFVGDGAHRPWGVAGC